MSMGDTEELAPGQQTVLIPTISEDAELENPPPPPSTTSSVVQPSPVPLPTKKSAHDFLWGGTLGEGAFARVVHARRKYSVGLKVNVKKTVVDRLSRNLLRPMTAVRDARASSMQKLFGGGEVAPLGVEDGERSDSTHNAEAPQEASLAQPPIEATVPCTIMDVGSNGKTFTVRVVPDADDAEQDRSDLEGVKESDIMHDHLAVKIMEKAHIVHNNKVEYVKQEKELLAKLGGSRWIVRLIASFQDPDNVFMVMPLAHGGMLLDLIKQQREKRMEAGYTNQAMTPEVARFYVAEVVCALDFLHSKDVLHRDLKPENILVMESGHLVLTDFGTALDASTGQGVVDFVGTPEYVSPEVLKDEPATAAADMWGLGVMVYQMMTGRLPFTAASEWLIFEVILAHCSGKQTFTYPPQVVQCGANALIGGLLHPEPDARYSIAAVKRHTFLDGLADDEDKLLASTPPVVPGVNKAVASETLVPFSQGWLLEQQMMGNEEMEDASQLDVSDIAGVDEAASPAVPVLSDEELARWAQFCDVTLNERVVHAGPTWKRKGLFSKFRILILTSHHRLLYVDPSEMELKGIIPWTPQHPVAVKKIDKVHFDILSPLGNDRAYHFMVAESRQLETWAKVIRRALDEQTRLYPHAAVSAPPVSQSHPL